MSGHSKWATTKRQKSVTDNKRGNLFTKLSRQITMAVNNNPNPDTNFKLRFAIDKARSYSMPKDNIEKAILKGSGGAEGVHYEEVMYEGFGPFGILVLVEALVDNPNRVFGEIKNVFTKNGGSLGGPNSVSWNFTKVGLIKASIAADKISEDFEYQLLEAGAEDFNVDGEEISIQVLPDNLAEVQNKLVKLGLTIKESSIIYTPKETVIYSDKEDAKISITKFFNALDALDDVQEYYTNTDL